MLVTIEGIDGAGKSTIIDYICSELSGFDIVKTAMPSNLFTGRQVKKALKSIDAKDEHLKSLFLRDFVYSSEMVIKPALRESKIVVSDRYIDSFIAYQSVIIDEGIIKKELESFMIKKPTITILLDIDPRKSLARITGEKDFIENKNIEIFDQIRNNYLRNATKDKRRWFVVDASVSKEELIESIKKIAYTIRKRKDELDSFKRYYKSRKKKSVKRPKKHREKKEIERLKEYSNKQNARAYKSKKLARCIDVENIMSRD